MPVIVEGKKYLSNEVKEVNNLKIYPAFRGKSSATKNSIKL